ncbi:MAG: SRPBCC family protein [Nocardioides sp.]
MELSHTFTVPMSVGRTWAHFNDIAALAECFPGAQVTSADGQTFAGSVKVKLGPIALVYNGSGTFVEKDEEAHRFVIDASGKDKRGNGTAGAKITVLMSAGSTDTFGTGATKVEVHTDLAITGKPAQFGRGVMQDVSDKLLGQFVVCLEQRLTAEASQMHADASQTHDEASPMRDDASQLLSEAPATRMESTDPSAAVTSDPELSVPAAPVQQQSLDLGKTVLPVLAKAYWKPVAGVVVGLIIVWQVLKRL